VEAERIFSARLIHHRMACCSRSKYQVRIVVHATHPLACRLCQRDLVDLGGSSGRDVRVRLPVEPAADVR
jgi:hypothetical protein